MKKIKLIAYAIVGFISVLSCRDAIDVVQDGELYEQDAIKSISDLRGFLNGNVYGALDTSSEIWLTSVFTDEAGLAPSNSGWYFAEHRYILTPDNSYVAGTWGSHYAAINRVNRLLEVAKLVTPAAGDETKRYNSILAEARTMRALAYLQLQSYFTTDMTNDNALGVILVEGVPTLDTQLPRVTNAKIYEQIESDLKYAEENLWIDDEDHKLDNYKFVTMNLVNAIRARMYLYRKDYTKAKQYAEDALIGITMVGPAADGTSNPYKMMWQDRAQGEIIFALSRPTSGPGGDIARFWTTNTTSISGSPLLKMGMNLYNLISSSWDIRGKAFVDPSSSATVKIIDKYPGKSGAPLKNDIKVFRASEMWFIIAEAEAAAGNLTVAADIVRNIRSNRRMITVTIPTPTYATKEDAYRDILQERRAELCFEGHRYVDLRRLGAIAGVSIDRSPLDDGDKGLFAPLTLPIDDYRWTYPIPSSERLGNPNIVQNPDY